MSLIPCTENCIYAQDGYCELNTPTIVTNNTNSSCVHKIDKPSKKATSQDLYKVK